MDTFQIIQTELQNANILLLQCDEALATFCQYRDEVSNHRLLTSLDALITTTSTAFNLVYNSYNIPVLEHQRQELCGIEFVTKAQMLKNMEERSASAFCK